MTTPPSPPTRVVPVAFRYRYRVSGEWTPWALSFSDRTGDFPFMEQEPLYAAPLPAEPAPDGRLADLLPEVMTPDMERVWRSAFIGQAHARRGRGILQGESDQLALLEEGVVAEYRGRFDQAAMAMVEGRPTKAPATGSFGKDSIAYRNWEKLDALRAAINKARTGGESVADGVYVASRASIPERGEMWRALRASGVNVTSSWIDEDGPKASRDLSGLWVRINREVTSSERLILYVEPDDFPLKGAFIEVGMALAANVPIVIVAPGVTLEERNCRPLGSWIKHPLVSFADTVDAALARTGGVA